MKPYRTYQPGRPRVTPAHTHRLRLGLIFLLIIAASIIGGFRLFGNHKISSLPVLSTVLHRTPPKTIVPLVLTSAQQSTMAVSINATIKAYPNMDIGVAVQDINDRRTYTYGLEQPFIAASVGKLITATMYLHGAETGKYSLNKKLSFGTAAYELQRMILVSDNRAWDDLARVLTHRGMLKYMQDMGIADYDADDNTLEPRDIAVLLGRLYRGELLNKANTQLLLSYMKKANYATYVPASVPDGINVYHKAGWLDDRVNDAAIIDDGKHPYVLVIFTKMDSGGNYNAAAGHKIFSAITNATLTAFTRP